MIGRAHVERLERLRELLIRRDERAGRDLRLLLFSGAGFMDPVRQAARSKPDLQLIDLERLYVGS